MWLTLDTKFFVATVISSEVFLFSVRILVCVHQMRHGDRKPMDRDDTVTVLSSQMTATLLHFVAKIIIIIMPVQNSVFLLRCFFSQFLLRKMLSCNSKH